MGGRVGRSLRRCPQAWAPPQAAVEPLPASRARPRDRFAEQAPAIQHANRPGNGLVETVGTGEGILPGEEPQPIAPGAHECGAGQWNRSNWNTACGKYSTLWLIHSAPSPLITTWQCSRSYSLASSALMASQNASALVASTTTRLRFNDSAYPLATPPPTPQESPPNTSLRCLLVNVLSTSRNGCRTLTQ